MESIWQVQERISFDISEEAEFDRRFAASTPQNQAYITEMVNTIYYNFMLKKDARPFSLSQAKQLYLSLIKYLELPEEEREVRRKQATQHKKSKQKENFKRLMENLK